MPELTPLQAAKRLAADLQLPAQRGSVFVWHTESGLCLVVAADPQWLTDRNIEIDEYLGYKVETRDRLNGIAYKTRH